YVASGFSLMPSGNCSALGFAAVTAARIRVPGPDRAARPAAGRNRRGPRPRTLPTGFSRGQAHLLGRLHTDSRPSDGNTLHAGVELPGGFARKTLPSTPPTPRGSRAAGGSPEKTPREKAFTSARKMREASIRGGLPAAAAPD